MIDGLATGRMVRILSVVDAYTRESVWPWRLTPAWLRRVTRVMERLIVETRRPENVRSDNGPEFTSRRKIAGPRFSKSVWCTSSRDARCRTDTWRASMETVAALTSASYAHWRRRTMFGILCRSGAGNTTPNGLTARSTISPRMSSARRSKEQGHGPAPFTKPQPLTPRISTLMNGSEIGAGHDHRHNV